ncbi:YraN family protein [Desulfogranum japonicum]|uniref:YraN family protein n=1 Tax=Desulfogranum japonicum TaxID=231447 RepID=UPI0004014294|nr:YraN family protein [Desulfogranum japonicum]
MKQVYRAQTGSIGEDIACERLQKCGYIIKERNYRKRFGEIDIIAVHQDVICFIEVKTRRSSGYGSGFDAVTSHKQRRLSRTALDYLTRQRKLDHPARFDVVSILLQKNRQPQVELLQNAFELIEL